MRRFLFTLFFLLLASCKNGALELSPNKKKIQFLFQNAVGLNLQSAGCSILDLGGAARMCQRVEQEEPDLFFQVGPSFSHLIPKSGWTPEQVLGARKALVEIWNLAGVSFYSVDSLDLSQGLRDFQQFSEQKNFRLLSTNLRDKSGKAPFEPFLNVKWGKTEFRFLSFTAPQPFSPGSDWQALPFKESLADLAPTVKDQAPANWIVLGSLSAAQRKEIAALIAGPAFFIGGSLEEENTTAWEPMGPNSFWGKAADLGRGMGKIEWNSAPTGGSKSMFTSKGLRKDLDAGNQCSKIVNELFGSSQ